MANFLDKPVKEQINLAINKGDPKLVQILLGPKYCQLGQYWMEHSVLSYKLVAMRQVINGTLPLSIINEQHQLLTEARNAFEIIDDDERNDALRRVKIGRNLVKELLAIIHRHIRDYRDTIVQLSKQNSFLFPSPDEVKKAVECKKNKQGKRPGNISATGELGTIMKANSNFSVDLYGGSSSLTPGIDSVLRLDLTKECNAVIDDLGKMLQSQIWEATDNYSAFFCYLDTFIGYLQNENLDGVIDSLPQSGVTVNIKCILSILRPLAEGLLQLENPNKESCRDRMKEELRRIEELSIFKKQRDVDLQDLSFALRRLDENIKEMQDNKLIDKEFVKDMYERLLNNYLRNAKGKTKALLYNDITTLDLDCVKKKIIKQHNDVKYEYLSDAIEKAVAMDYPNIDVINVLLVNVAHSDSLNQLFRESKHKRIRDFVTKSKNTIMIDANNILFDFQCDDFPVAAFCSLGGNFRKDSEKKIMLTKTGDYVCQEIMQRCKTFKEYLEKNWESKTKKERDYIDGKMTELFEKVQCSISRCDEGVMHDYINEVKERIKFEKNKDVLDLYNEVTHNTWRDWFFSWFYEVGKKWQPSERYSLQSFLNDTSKKIRSLEKEQAKVDKAHELQKDDFLSPHKNYHIGEAIGGGDCFFHSVLQGLKDYIPESNLGVKVLRKMCFEYANSNENNQWFKKAVVKDANSKAKEDDIWNAYITGIKYTKNKIKELKDDGSSLHKLLTNDEYGSTLVAPIWGRPEIEGRAICQVLNKKYQKDVEIHVFERHDLKGEEKKEVWTSQIIDSNGSRSSNDIDYEKNNVIHIINSGNGHFLPLLRK